MEYNLEFSERLIEAANSFFEKEITNKEAGRAVL
jgi:hypothetical protein